MPNVDENKELMGFLEVKRIHRIMLIRKQSRGHFLPALNTTPFNIVHCVCWLHYICSTLNDTPHWRLLVVSSANFSVFHRSDAASTICSHLHQQNLSVNFYQTHITAFYTQCRRLPVLIQNILFQKTKSNRSTEMTEKLPAKDCTLE